MRAICKLQRLKFHFIVFSLVPSKTIYCLGIHIMHIEQGMTEYWNGKQNNCAWDVKDVIQKKNSRHYWAWCHTLLILVLSRQRRQLSVSSRTACFTEKNSKIGVHREKNTVSIYKKKHPFLGDSGYLSGAGL